MRNPFDKWPPLARVWELACELKDNEYPLERCHITIEDAGDDLRGKVRRLSDDDAKYTALVPKSFSYSSS